MMQSEANAPRDLRYPCFVTVLAILLFLPELFLMGLLPRLASMMGDMGVDLPIISRGLVASPLVILLFFVGLMISTIFFAWCDRKGAIPASISLLMQGIALGLHLLACLLPWVQVMNALGTQ